MYITEKKLLKWSLYSNAIYIALFFLFTPDGISVQKIVITSFLLFSFIAFLFLCYKNRAKILELSLGSRIVFKALIIWSCVTIIRSFSLSIQDWVTNFGNMYMALAWLTPMLLILGLKIENWKIVLQTIPFMFSIMILAFFFIPFLELNAEWIWLLRLVNFVLLIGLYHYGLKGRLQAYLIIVIYLIVALLTERRMEFLYLAMVFGFLLMDKLFEVRIRKSFIKYIFIGFLSVFIIVFTVGYEYVSNIVASFIDFQDSRTFLFKELMQELNYTEKIIGRGSLGTYFSEFMDHTKWYTEEILKHKWWGDSATRITTEVGYLQMILKGGFIMLILNLLLFLYSSYLAIFKSNNKFIKRLGYFILILTIISLIEFRPAFTPIFFILWMAIGTVLNKKYRDMDDQEIEPLITIK